MQDLVVVPDRAGSVGVKYAHHIAGFAKQSVRQYEILIARRQNRRDPDMTVARQLRNRSERGDADGAAEDDDVLPCRIELKADAEWADHIEVVARPERRQPAGAAADAFVEELDPAAGAVDTIN